MELRGSEEPPPPTPVARETVAEVPGVAAAGEDSQPGSLRLPLILLAVVGALAGALTVLVSVSTRVDVAAVDAPAGMAKPAASAAAPTAPVVASAPPPAWTGARRPRWASDGSKTIAFELAATSDVPVWMSRARPVLVVRCLSRATEVFVALDTSASFEQDADRRTVHVQWDDDAPALQHWGASESRQELFAPDGVDFVRRMAQARRLRFGFAPFNAHPVTADFAVQGFDQLAGLVAGSCGWSLDRQVSSNRPKLMED